MGMQVNPLMLAQPAVEEEVEEDDAMGVAETYSDYMPAKCECLFIIVTVHMGVWRL